jgi:hypothetical protein
MVMANTMKISASGRRGFVSRFYIHCSILFAFLICINISSSWAGSPFPKSLRITGITFDRNKAHLAEGSDNWPITWGSDDRIYTAYGDGWGFHDIGKTPKARLGVASLSGPPTNIAELEASAVDLAVLATWNDKIPNIKATGILMINGDLFM